MLDGYVCPGHIIMYEYVCMNIDVMNMYEYVRMNIDVRVAAYQQS